MNRTFLSLAAILGFLGVALGAFGAHGLKGQIEPALLQAYQTGVFYHLIHSLALLGIGLIAAHKPESRPLRWSGWLMLSGIILFSGSLYVMAISGIRILGAVTPFGGTAMLLGWIALFLAVRK